MYLAVKKVIFSYFFYFTSELLSLINAYQNVCGLSDSRYNARVMPKCDFFPKKRMKEMFAYVFEFMLTFDKMQIPVLYCAQSLKSEDSYSSFSYSIMKA